MMGIVPDGSWLKAFTLPARVIAGLAVVFLGLFALERWFATPVLSAILGADVGGAVIVAGLLLFGTLTAGNIAAALSRRGKAWWRKRTAAKLQAAKAEEARTLLLGRLDHLSKEELYHIGKALKKGGQSFYAYVHDPALGTLMEKLLLQTPGGTHNQDHYPFTFPDFVWVELQRRRDEFLEKGETAIKQIEADRRR